MQHAQPAAGIEALTSHMCVAECNIIISRLVVGRPPSIGACPGPVLLLSHFADIDTLLLLCVCTIEWVRVTS